MRRPAPISAVVVLALAGLLVPYTALYVAARRATMIVHTKSWTYDAAGKRVTSSHDVVAGDAKLASPNGLVAGLFTPLRWGETLAWHLIDPVTR